MIKKKGVGGREQTGGSGDELTGQSFTHFCAALLLTMKLHQSKKVNIQV